MSRRERKAGAASGGHSSQEAQIYAGDSFFTLGPSAQAGLALLSLALAVLTLAAARALARGRSWLGRLLVGLGIALAFEWLSPQLYYAFYLLIFEELPLQWVTGPPDPQAMLEIMLVQRRPSLSAHARAALYWACIAVALLAGPRPRHDPPALG